MSTTTLQCSSRKTTTWLSLLLGVSIILATSKAEDSELGDLDYYKISWKGPLTTTETFDEENVINIATNTNERFKCIVPDTLDHLNFDSSATNSSSGKQVKNPIQILEPLLSSNYCSYKFELFWVYELCHGKFLRQYHEESSKFKAKITQEYFLGKIEPDQIEAHSEEYDKEMAELDRTGQARPTILINGHHKPYVMFNMTSGTECDLTKRSRTSRIIYVCSEEPKHELYSIKEISTCEYEAIVLSPRLCQHRDFRIDTKTHQDIKCFSLDNSSKKPAKLIESEEEDLKSANKPRGMAYFQGRTLIIDADLILS